ncbi:MAG: tetratricopeptide repeat protein [Methanobacteriota archaeon]|nr:MAG: tetratricopeptide repeat protein [Euryarchaeota archaeon]
MKNVVLCPACNATNKPRAVTCRVCGQRLVESRTKGGTREPVVLQRVMTGEVFSAVVVPGEGAIPVKELPRSALTTRSVPGKAASPSVPPAGLSDSDVSKLLREILALSQRGDYAQAVATADRILEERENDPKALILKADALFRAGRRKEAAEVFDDLIHIDPENAKIWLDRARIQKAMEKFPESLESYDRAVVLDETLADAWYERATVLDVLKDATEALRSLARALSLRPDHAPATLLRVDLEKRKSTEAVRAVADEITRELEEIEGRARARAAEPEPFDADATPEAVFASISEPGAVPAPARPVAAEARARVKGRMYTYVEGLDEALNGGIPEGHVVVIAGPPGTMKSSLCLTVATYNAAKERRPSLYITLEESRESFQIQAGSLGLPLEDAAGLLMFLDARDLRASVPRAGDDWVDAFAAGLEALRTERPFDLLVLDSLEGLEAIARFTDRRRAIFRLFERLRSLAVTTLVIAERPDILFHGNVVYGRWSEDFLADGILHLRQHLVSDVEVARRIRIVKMRGTRHETAYMSLLVDEGRLRATRAMAA